MNCNELDNVLHEFLDRRLARDKMAEVSNHLASCRHCALRVAEFERGERLLKALPSVQPPANFLERVREKIALEKLPASERDIWEEAAARVEAQERKTFGQVLMEQLQARLWLKVALGGAVALTLVSFIMMWDQTPRNESYRSYTLAKNEPTAPKGLPVERLAEERSRDSADEVELPTAVSGIVPSESKDTDAPETESAGKVIADRMEKGALQLHSEMETKERSHVAQDTEDLPGLEKLKLRDNKPPVDAPAVTGGKVAGEMSPEEMSEKQVAGRAFAKREVGKKAEVADGTAARAGQRLGAVSEARRQSVTNELEFTQAAPVAAAALEPPPAPSAPNPPGAVVATAPLPMPESAQPSPATAARKASEPLAKADVPAMTNLPAGIQSGYLDLATLSFYLELRAGGQSNAFVRGYLERNGRFKLISREVEGRVVSLSVEEASKRGTHGWLVLSTQDFVAYRLGIKPSYPYIEGYKDERGEFHPISRKIYQAGQ